MKYPFYQSKINRTIIQYSPKFIFKTPNELNFSVPMYKQSTSKGIEIELVEHSSRDSNLPLDPESRNSRIQAGFKRTRINWPIVPKNRAAMIQNVKFIFESFWSTFDASVFDYYANIWVFGLSRLCAKH